LTQAGIGEGKKSERLSDSIKSLSAQIPETKVLESKIDKMITLEPRVNSALSKLDKITTLP
jgi:hypothetical protein